MFFPAAGNFTGEALWGMGQSSDFWTSTPDGNNKAYRFYVTNGDSDIWSIERSDLGTDEMGLSIRPVVGWEFIVKLS